MHKGGGFSAKPLGKSLFHCQNVWSGHGLAGQFRLLESVLSMLSNYLAPILRQADNTHCSLSE